MKKLIESNGPIPTYVKKHHLENFKNLIKRTDKIAESEWMKAARQIVQNVSHSGRSEGEVKSRLVSVFSSTFKFFTHAIIDANP